MPDPLREFEEARRLLVRAVAEIKGGEYKTARFYLEKVLNVSARGEQKADAYYWLSEISENEAEKRDHLHSALGYDLGHHRARRSLAVLDGKLDPAEIIDPDSFQPTEEDSPVRGTSRRFECPNCGSPMVYSADGGSLWCEYCDSKISKMPEHQLLEHEFVLGIATAKGHQHPSAIQSFECVACGAVYLLAPEVLSLTCPHCGAEYAVVQMEERSIIPPEGMIPFEMSEGKVHEVVRRWCIEKGLKPGAIHFGQFSGLYLPCWTFDLGGKIKWTGYREVYDNQTVPIRESAVIQFDDFFVPASQPQPDFLRKLLREFRAEDVQPYQPAKTASFLAESYNISMADAALEARAQAFDLAKKRQLEKPNLRRVENLQFTSDEMILESYKLVLVPVWLGSLTHQEDKIGLLINGKTGRIYPEKPAKRFGKLVEWLLGE